MRALPVLTALLVAACAGGPAAPPTVESRASFEVYEPQGGQFRRLTPTAIGRAVVSAADPRAAAAGARMLELGGTAADAAIATMVALTVVEPQSSGIGGGAFVLWHDPATGGVVTIDGRERAPAAARPDRFLHPDGRPMSFREAVPGGRSVGVPGVVKLAAEMHRRWGRLPWATLFGPAIAMAEDGIVLSERFVRFAAFRAETLRALPAGRVFLAPDGQPWPAGHRLRQPELARTLREIAVRGPEAFYRGRVAHEIVRAVAEAPVNPARITLGDLKAYRVVERPPLCAPYRGHRICTMGPPSAGGIALLQILLQLERFDLSARGPADPIAWHLLAESMRLAFADREVWGGDPDFAPIPVAGLLDPTYLAARSALIRPDRAMAEVTAGVPPGAGQRAAPRRAEVPATSHLVAADAEGRVACVTSTIEAPWGSGLMAAGFLLNNELTDFDFVPTRDGRPALNRVEGGKRPRSSMTPTLVFAPDGRLVAAFGAAGGATIIAQVAKAIVAFLDWGLPVEAALAAPQLVADARGLRYEAGTPLETMVATWKALGHRDVAPATLPLKANAVARQGDRWRGAADPRSEGAAVAVAGAPGGEGEGE
ncbi:MAG: gamma-glutamyltransferase [Sphingomonadaceae bacterium]|uniref:gamma-glutamyltransferase n=1 Tax=Thermaurantiacus sp. TaxID=2820283 RepID=UPI00298ED1D1|nr:gamma-glutamyltransferase [Thermaurantiacus sp.]MCS6987367.1 gamma-glutamyltransferase [Sphingomonadaceae bacterium]MDW8414588.1 gamma-glutamyltransferase [Thermaurantiacus sp.]